MEGELKLPPAQCYHLLLSVSPSGKVDSPQTCLRAVKHLSDTLRGLPPWDASLPRAGEDRKVGPWQNLLSLRAIEANNFWQKTFVKAAISFNNPRQKTF